MELRDVLGLPKTRQSIAEVESFLALSWLQEKLKDALQATYFLADIYVEINEQSKAKTLLENVLKSDELIHEPEHYDKLSSFLVQCYLHEDNPKEAFRVISQKQQILPMTLQYRHRHDSIAVLLFENNKTTALELIDASLQDDIPDDERLWLLSQRILNRLQFDTLFDDLEKAKKLAEILNDRHIKATFELFEAQYYFEIKNYDQAFDHANTVVQQKVNQEQTGEALDIMLNIYILNENYHRASILEAEHEALIDAVSEPIRLKLYETCIRLYQAMKNKISEDTYQRKRKPLLAKKTVQPTPKEIKTSKKDIKSPTFHDTIKAFEAIELLASQMNQDPSTQFRDVFLDSAMCLQTMVPFKEIVIMTFADKPMAFHYKKSRVYDKSFDKNDIHKTPLGAILSLKNDMVLTAGTAAPYHFDILTNKTFIEANIPSVYAYPLKQKDTIFGGILVYGESETMQHDVAYDLFKAYAALCAIRLITAQTSVNNELFNTHFLDMFNSDLVAVKYDVDHTITLNSKAQKHLGLFETANLADIVSLIAPEDVNSYKDIMKKLYGGYITKTTLEYSLSSALNSRRIKEDFMAKPDQKGRIHITSVLHDITNNYETLIDHDLKARRDSLTGLNNLYQCKDDIKALLASQKFTLCVLDIDSYKTIHELYGQKATEQVLITFSDNLKKLFPAQGLYRLAPDEFAILFYQTNDKRTIEKNIRQLFDTLTVPELKQQNLAIVHLNVGSVRYPVVTSDKDVDTLLSHARLAASLAKRKKRQRNLSEHHLFTGEDYKREVFEHQVITHIIEAIDHQLLQLKYRQIIDLTNHKVRHYEPTIHTPNFDVAMAYIYAVASKRGLRSYLDRYLLTKTYQELAAIQTDTEKLIRVSIPLSIKTIQTKDALNFMSQLTQKYDIPASIITLDLFDLPSTNEPDLAYKCRELKSMGYHLGTTNIDAVFHYEVDHLRLVTISKHINHPKGVSYLSAIHDYSKAIGIDLIVEHVDTDEQLKKIKHENIAFIAGKIYGKQLSKDEVIRRIKG